MNPKEKLGGGFLELPERINPANTYTWIPTAAGIGEFSTIANWQIGDDPATTCPQNGDTIDIGANRQWLKFDRTWNGTINASTDNQSFSIASGVTVTAQGSSSLGDGNGFLDSSACLVVDTGATLTTYNTGFARMTNVNQLLDVWGTLKIANPSSSPHCCGVSINVENGGTLQFADTNQSLKLYTDAGYDETILWIKGGGIIKLDKSNCAFTTADMGVIGHPNILLDGWITQDSTGTNTIGVPMDATGTVRVASGSLSFTKAWTSGDGSGKDLLISPDGVLNMNTGTNISFSHGLITDSAFVYFHGNGSIGITGDTDFGGATTIDFTEPYTKSPTVVNQLGRATLGAVTTLEMEVSFGTGTSKWNDQWNCTTYSSGDNFTILSGAAIEVGTINPANAADGDTFHLITGNYSGTFDTTWSPLPTNCSLHYNDAIDLVYIDGGM
jgi:hypothetical protein